MGLLDIFKKKKEGQEQQSIHNPVQKPEQQPVNQNSLLNDIGEMSEWVVKALNFSGYKADYSLESMKEIDRFFDEQNNPNGILNQNRGQILFALGSYVGETVIRLYGGKWITDDNDPQGEINIAVETNDGTTLWPVQRCMKRYSNGTEDSIYAYVYALSK